jgi:peptidoglycan L-alanyl-D-glutamate endopeptidase CwlK
LEGPALNFLFGTRSEILLKDLNPKLVGVLRLALSYDVMDFTVIETLRTLEQEKGKVAAGLSKTLNSKHLAGPDGKSRAVDVAPWPMDWKDTERFKKLGALVKRAAGELGVKISWGGDWKKKWDWGHFELA